MHQGAGAMAALAASYLGGFILIEGESPRGFALPILIVAFVAACAVWLFSRKDDSSDALPGRQQDGDALPGGKGGDVAGQITRGDHSPAIQVQNSPITVNPQPSSRPASEPPLHRVIANGIAELEQVRRQLLRAEEAKELRAKTPDRWQAPLGDLLTDQGWHQTRKVIDNAYGSCEDLWERLYVPARKFEGPFADIVIPTIEDSDDLPAVLAKVETAIDELRGLQAGGLKDSILAASSPPASPDEAIKHLKDVVTEYSNAKILVFPAHQVPIARYIASLFEIARWKINFNETPQEPLHHRYVEGIEVSGFNDHVVGVVVSALKQADIPMVSKVITRNQIAQDSPKYQHAVEGVRVTIGHTPSHPPWRAAEQARPPAKA